MGWAMMMRKSETGKKGRYDCRLWKRDEGDGKWALEGCSWCSCFEEDEVER